MSIFHRNDGFVHPVPSEITPQRVYEERRMLLRGLATGAAGATLAALVRTSFTMGTFAR